MANRADQRQHHYIYKITRVDGKYYIGMHSTDDLEDGYFGSGHLLARSVRAHGKEKHSKEILEFLPTRKELAARERILVNEEILDDAKCMNLRLGGEGGFAPGVGKLGNEGFKNKLRVDPEFKAQMDENWKRASIARHAALKQKHPNGTWSGKQHSEETKKLMSAADRTGQKNSQFETCWVTNGAPKKIKLAELHEYLERGYSRGRKSLSPQND